MPDLNINGRNTPIEASSDTPLLPADLFYDPAS